MEMIKYLILVILLTFVGGTSFDKVQWTRTQGNNLTDNPLFASLDSTGGLIYTETYLGDYSPSILNVGGNDVLLVRINSDGSDDWVSSYGSAFDETVISFSLDNDNSYVVVDTQSTFPISSVVAVDISDGTLPWTVGYENGTLSIGAVGALNNKLFTVGIINGTYELAGGIEGISGKYTVVLIEYLVNVGNEIVAISLNVSDSIQTISGFAVTDGGAFIAINDAFISKYNTTSYSLDFIEEIIGDVEIWLLTRDDNGGGIYVAGKFQTTATFGSETVTSSRANGDVFLAKLSETGVWSDVTVLTAVDVAADITKLSLAVSEDIYIGLEFIGTYDFGSESISSLTETGAVAVLSRNGTWLNATTFTASEGSSVVAVAAEADILYVIGSFKGQMQVSNYTISADNIDVFIIKFNVTTDGTAPSDSCFLSMCACSWCKLVAIIAGCVVFLIILIIIIVVAVKKAKKRTEKKTDHKMEKIDINGKELEDSV